MNVDALMTYLEFVIERHRIWEARQAAGQWSTSDPILASRKFTNVFRILDPGTQFAVRELLDPELDPRDALMRVFLYRHTGRVEAWEWLALVTGGYPVVSDLQDLFETWSPYRGKQRIQAQTRVPYAERTNKQTNRSGGVMYRVSERSIFTRAYLVFPQSQERGVDKLQSIIDLTRRLFDPASPDDVVPSFLGARSLAERVGVLNAQRGVGPFMAMQVATDWGYSTHQGVDAENTFVLPGPGARRGAAELDPTAGAVDVVLRCREILLRQPDCPRLEIRAGVWREPSLMDVQNTMCEYSKFVRYLHRAPTAVPYRPQHPGPQERPQYPEFWR